MSDPRPEVQAILDALDALGEAYVLVRNPNPMVIDFAIHGGGPNVTNMDDATNMLTVATGALLSASGRTS